jgi:hypothetical protein
MPTASRQAAQRAGKSVSIAAMSKGLAFVILSRKVARMRKIVGC